jgi:hypothetical protein
MARHLAERPPPLSTVFDIATFGGSVSEAKDPDQVVIRSTNDKCDAIVQERV